MGFAVAASAAELERRVPEIAAWMTTLPAGSRHGIAQAFRQTLDAAVQLGADRLQSCEACRQQPGAKTSRGDPV